MGEREIFFDNFSLMNLCFLLAVYLFYHSDAEKAENSQILRLAAGE